MSGVPTHEAIKLVYKISPLLSTCGSSPERLIKWQFGSPLLTRERFPEAPYNLSVSFKSVIRSPAFQL